jgi:hypothetical protein
VVLTNQDAADAASEIGNQVRSALLKSENPQDQKEDEKILKVYDGLQQGKIDRSLFTDNANSYFIDQALKDYASSLGPLGAPQSFTASGTSLRRDDGTDLCSEVSSKEPGDHHLRNARRKARAVSNRGEITAGRAREHF